MSEKKKRKIELLAPAGSPEICRAVISAGADAVYLGGERFSARAHAPNFSEKELLDAIDFAHLHQKKVYLTVNTLLKNRELEEQLFPYLSPLYENGLDAVILQDIGAAAWIREQFPDLPLHASTQMSACSSMAAEFLLENGFKRMVAARELSLDELAAVHAQTGIEIECFVHGALCYCYSGQCLFSSILGGRSGNRGRCAQPCRLPYQIVDSEGIPKNRKKELYPLSAKDLCAVRLLDQLCDAGIDSLKIEGRMKQADYAAGVTAVYRECLDRLEAEGSFQVTENEQAALTALGNRSGFTEGYFLQRNGRTMLSLKSPSHRSGDLSAVIQEKKIPYRGEMIIHTGKPAVLRVCCRGRAVSVSSKEIVQKARKQPLNEETVRRQLSRTGGTEFEAAEMKIDLSGDAFLTIQTLNQLRRDALSGLKEKLLEDFRRHGLFKETKTCCRESSSSEAERKDCGIHVLVHTAKQLDAVRTKDYIKRIYLELPYPENCRIETLQKSGKEVYAVFPYIFRADAQERFLKTKDDFLAAGYDGVLVRSYDSLQFVRKYFPGLSLTADACLYTWSDRAVRAMTDNGCRNVTVPFELNEKELLHRDNRSSELIVYCRIPLMHTAQCIYKNFAECGESQEPLYLLDRQKQRFFVSKDCQNCSNTIYNSRPLNLFSSLFGIRKMNFSSLRLEFLTESGGETEAVLSEFERCYAGAAFERASAEFTNGHFKRGVR